MESLKARGYLGKIINFGNFFGYTPYTYDPQSEQVKFDSSRLTKWKYILNIVILAFYELSLLSNYLLSLLTPRTSSQVKLRGLSICIAYLGLNICHYISIRNYGTLHQFWNEFMRTTAVLKREAEVLLTPSHGSQGKGRNFDKRNRIAIIGGMLSTAIPAILRAVKVLKSPQTPGLVSTGLGVGPKDVLLKVLLALLQLNVAGFQLYSMQLMGNTIITYIFFCLPVLQDMILEKSKLYSQRHEHRIPFTVHKVNSTLLVLQTIFNGCFKYWPFATEVICVLTVITRLFLAVKLGSVKDLVAGLTIFITLVIFFIGFGEIQEESEEARRSWGGIRRPRWFPKYLKSCRPIRVSVGDFFYADKNLILTMISIVIANTTTLVLTVRDFEED